MKTLGNFFRLCLVLGQAFVHGLLSPPKYAPHKESDLDRFPD